MRGSAGSIFIESLSWPQAADAIKSLPTVLIPLGARCKEHGPHLPLNTDWIMAEYLARRVAEQAPVLVLPTVQYGFYPAFLDYPGSISLGEVTFRDSIADICRSLARHGTERFYILNTGISTIRPLAAAKELLRAEKIPMEFSDLRTMAISQRKAVQQQSHGTHADELETSIMLYIAPDQVRMELARPELAADAPGPLTRDASRPGVYSPTGSWGDPTLATPEKGRIIVEAIVRELVVELNNSRSATG